MHALEQHGKIFMFSGFSHVNFAVFSLWRAGGRPFDLQFAGARNDEVSGFVLIAVSVTTDHDRLLPTSHQTWDVRANDRFSVGSMN